jgi:hypothetical protein
MARVRFGTTIDRDLIHMAKEKAEQNGLDGANAVIEAALRLYFANCATEVWEKTLTGGWIKKIIVRPGKVVIESIRSRKVRSRYNPQTFSDDSLTPKGWKKVWKMKQG